MNRMPSEGRFPSARFASVLFVAAVLATRTLVTASCGTDPECDDVSAWAVFTRVALHQSVIGSPEVMEWLGSFDQEANDASIDIATRGSKEPMTGTIALVGGRVMLGKGLNLQPGYEIDALDAPILSMRLVMSVLKRIFPNGPDQFVGTIDVDRTDSVGIKYATPSASGYIPPPWHVKGKVSRTNDGRVVFEWLLRFSMKQQDEKNGSFVVNMKGELARLDRPVFRDGDSLDGWTTYGIGPQETKQASSTIFDYGAKRQDANTYKTIGDIRAFITAANDPGVRDAAKDFTGFWKQKCEEAFGLQIKHFGDDGKYSVVFCGPGGCGDPSERRPTFITGDKRYEVVSEGELVEIGQSGERQTYYRCTKDTNPVLKYRKQ